MIYKIYAFADKQYPHLVTASTTTSSKEVYDLIVADYKAREIRYVFETEE